MLIERDTETGASYLVLDEDAEIDRTIHLSDLVMVDVDSSGVPVGVEFATGTLDGEPAREGWRAVVEAFPALQSLIPDLSLLH